MTIKKFSVLVCLVEGSIIQSTSLEHEKYKLAKHSIDFSLSYSLNNRMCKNKFSKKKEKKIPCFPSLGIFYIVLKCIILCTYVRFE